MIDQGVLLDLQRGLPLLPRPYEAVAQRYQSDANELVEFIQQQLDSGVIRRFGAVFNTAQMGYISALFAVNLPESEIDRLMPLLNQHPGITHNYKRSGTPNIWFTLTAERTHFENETAQIRALLAPHALYSLPMSHKFKVEAVFDPRTGESQSAVTPDAPEAVPFFSAADKVLIRTLQHYFPVHICPYRIIAERLQIQEDALLKKLNYWKEIGVLRRIGAVVRHRKVGVSANEMLIFSPENEAETLRMGRALADSPLISHCYARKMPPDFPIQGTLFAMIHGPDEAALEAALKTLCAACRLPMPLRFKTECEFKKSSPDFFAD